MFAERSGLRKLVGSIALVGILATGFAAIGRTYYKVRAELYTTSDRAELSVDGAEILVDWWAPDSPVNGLHVYTSPSVRLEKPCCLKTSVTVQLDLLVFPSGAEAISWTLAMGAYGSARLKLFAMPDAHRDSIRLASVDLRAKGNGEETDPRTVRVDLAEITTNAASGEGPNPSSPSYVEAESHVDIEYASLPYVEPTFLSLDLMLPPRDLSSPPPLVVFIHGGAMFGGDKQSLEVYYNDVTNIVGTSYAVASINYRLMPGYTFPAQLHDVRSAIQWLRAHAEHYGYDGSRIGLWGFSSGGCLALLLGLTEGVDELAGTIGDHTDISTEVSVVCSYAGTADFRTMVGGVPWGYLGCEEGDMDFAAFVSPISHASPDDPPIFLLHGTWDQFLPFEQTVTLFDLLQKAGVISQLVLVEGAMHGGPTGWWGEGPRAVRDFLDTHLLGD